MRFAIFGFGRGRDTEAKLPPVLCVRCGGAGVLGRNAEGDHECGAPMGFRGCAPAALNERARGYVREWYDAYNGEDGGLLAAAFDDRIDGDVNVGVIREIWKDLKRTDEMTRHFQLRAAERNERCPTP